MLLQKTSLYLLLNIFNAILGFITISVVSKYMGPEPIGIIASILAFISLFDIFGDFGFGLAHQKRISEGRDLGKCIGTYASVNIVLSVLIIIIIMGVFITNKYVSDTPYIVKENETIFYILLTSSFISKILKVISVTFTARLEVAKEVIIQFATKLALSVAKTSVAIIGLGVVYLALANLFSVIIAVFFSIVLFWKYPFSFPSISLFRSYAKFALPVAFIGAAQLYINLDKVFIAKFVGVEEVAFYTTAFGIVNFFYLFGSTFINILLPTFSKMNSEGNTNAISNIAIKAERYLSIILSPMIIFVAVFSTPITMLVLGSQFKSSALIMSILVINALVLNLSRPYSIQTLGTDKLKSALTYQVIIAVVNILLNLILIPKQLFGIPLFGLGGMGAAIALLLANLIGMSLFRLKAIKISGRGINPKILIHILSAFSVFGILYYFFNIMINNNVIYLLIAAIIGEVLYILILILVGELNKQDMKFFLNVVNIKKMKNYIAGEIKNDKIN